MRVVASLFALSSCLKVIYCCISTRNLSANCVFVAQKMLEKLSRYFPAEGELFRGKSRWTSAAVAVILLGLFASSCWAEEASCHGAYDLYFVLDK